MIPKELLHQNLNLELLGNMYVVVYVQGTFFSSESNLKTTVVCKGKKLQEKSKPCVDI